MSNLLSAWVKEWWGCTWNQRYWEQVMCLNQTLPLNWDPSQTWNIQEHVDCLYSGHSIVKILSTILMAHSCVFVYHFTWIIFALLQNVFGRWYHCTKCDAITCKLWPWWRAYSRMYLHWWPCYQCHLDQRFWGSSRGDNCVEWCHSSTLHSHTNFDGETRGTLQVYSVQRQTIKWQCEHSNRR